MNPAWVLAGVPAAAAICLWAVIDLERFVLLAVLGATIYPATVTKVGGSNVAVVDILLAIALLSWLINNSIRNAPDPWLRRNWVVLAAIAFAGLQWLSLAWTDDISKTVAFGIQSVELFVAFPMLFATIPRHASVIRAGMNFYLLLSVILAVALVIHFGTSHQARVLGTYLPGLDKNASGSFEAVAFVIAATFVLRHGRFLRWTTLVVGIDLLGLLATESRGAIIGAVAGILLVGLTLGRGRLAMAMLVILVAALYFGVIAPDIHLKTQSVGSYSSSQARIVIWKDALHKISERPLLGTGGGTYFDKHTGQPDPNNTVLLTMAEVGIPGLTLFLVLLGSFIASARRAIRSKSSEISTLAVAATGTVVVLLFHFEVDVTWARGAASLMMAMMGLTAALWRMARDESLASDTPELEPATEREAVHV